MRKKFRCKILLEIYIRLDANEPEPQTAGEEKFSGVNLTANNKKLSRSFHETLTYFGAFFEELIKEFITRLSHDLNPQNSLSAANLRCEHEEEIFISLSDAFLSSDESFRSSCLKFFVISRENSKKEKSSSKKNKIRRTQTSCFYVPPSRWCFHFFHSVSNKTHGVRRKRNCT